MKNKKTDNQAGRHFIEFLKREKENPPEKKERHEPACQLNSSAQGIDLLKIEYKEKPRLKSISLKNILPLVNDKNIIHDFDVSDEMAVQWLNAHLEEKKNLFSNSKKQAKINQFESRAKTLNVKRRLSQNNFFNPEKMFKASYTLLAVLLLSAFLSFQKLPSTIAINFFDSLFLSPLKLISHNSQKPGDNLASTYEKSNYIIKNYKNLQAKQEHDIKSIKIYPSDLKGAVAGVSEAGLPQKNNKLSAFLDDLAAKQKDLSISLSEKLSEMIKKQ